MKNNSVMVYGRLMGMLLKDRPISFVGYWLLVVAQSIFPALAVLALANLLQQGEMFLTNQSDFSVFIHSIIIYGVVQLSELLLSRSTFVLTSSFQRLLVGSMNLRIFHKTQKISLERFEQSDFYDSFTQARNVLNSGRFINYMRRTIFCIQSGISALAMAATLIWFSSWLVFSIVLAVIPVMVLRIVRGKQFWQLQWFQSPRERELAYLSEVLTGKNEAKEMRVFQASDFIIGKYRALRDELREERWKFERKNLIHELIFSIGTTEVVAYVLGIGVAVMAFLRGDLILSSFVATLISLRTFQEKTRSAVINITFSMEGGKYISNLFMFLDEPEEVVSHDTYELSTYPLVIEQGIQLTNVHFRYPGMDEAILKGINMDARVGEKIAIVGDNGAGKSTLIKLILGLYQPSEGTVTYDGNDVRTINGKRFRSELSIVSQNYVCYQFSVEDNIGFGKIDSAHSLLSVEQAAEASGADTFIQWLPKRYKTRLGKEFPESTDISGGQWQSLAMSRGFMRTPQVIVMDEPTSALDPMKESEIHKRFMANTDSPITILVSHRLGVCRFVDRIFVLSEGRLAEAGTHDELMACQGLYAHMFHEQAKWYT